jgi:hypothetical protein
MPDGSITVSTSDDEPTFDLSQSRRGAVDIPEELPMSRHFRDKLAAIADQYPESSPVNLVLRIPHITGAFVGVVMELEVKLNALQQRLDS